MTNSATLTTASLLVSHGSPRAMTRKQNVYVIHFGKSLSRGELKGLRERMNSLSYLRAEHTGRSDITVQVEVPNELLAGFFGYLGESDDSVKAKMIFRVEDKGNVIRITVPRNMYDDKKGLTFDWDVLGRFRKMAMQARHEAAG